MRGARGAAQPEGTGSPGRRGHLWLVGGGAQPAGRGLVPDPVPPPARMGSSSLSEDYRLCLERELRRGRAGVCGDPSLRAVLWQILVEDFDLHGALQDDALALLTDGLWGRADLAPALRGLARAFELLELAAVHLYLLPWRKEFSTIKVGRRAEAAPLLGLLCTVGAEATTGTGISEVCRAGWVSGAQKGFGALWGSFDQGRPPTHPAVPGLKDRVWVEATRPRCSHPGEILAPQSLNHCPPPKWPHSPCSTEIPGQGHRRDLIFHGHPDPSMSPFIEKDFGWAYPL